MAANPWTGERPKISEETTRVDHILSGHSVERGQSKKGAFNTESAAQLGQWLGKALNSLFDNRQLNDAWANVNHTYRVNLGETIGWSRDSGESTTVIEFAAIIKMGGDTTIITAYPY